MIRRTLLQSVTCAFARSAIGTAYALRWGKFRRKLDDATRLQREWLLRRVVLGRETRFGRDHGFSEIHTLDDFRRRVPIARYEAFAPYVDAVAAGDVAALVPPSERLVQFTITTGSGGSPKLNPVTDTWLREYRAAWDLWGLKLFADHPANLGDQMLQLAGKWDMGCTSSGARISMVSALLAREQNPFLRPFFATPSEVNDIPDPIARYYTALRLSIVQRVGWIVLMNPGTLVLLAELGDRHKQSLLRDLRDGRLSEEFDVPQTIRDALAARLRRSHPRRADELAQIIERTGRLYPRDYWDAPVVVCWLGGTAGFQSRALPQFFGDVPQRDMGLVSSEGRHTIPIEDGKPEGVPSIGSGFYEYVPVAEIDAARPIALEGRELEIDRDYYLMMTTSAGFYRYHIGDVIRCRGFVGEAPILEFVQKGDRVGDLEGEKLTEHQFLESAHGAAVAVGARLTEITAVPTREADGRARYVVVVEEGDLPGADSADQFLAELERRLAAINFLYAARRREGTLLPLRLQWIPSGEWARHIRAETDRRGTGDYQYKHPGLVQDAAWLRQFEA